MSFTVFIGNLPVWVTADDIRSWLNAEGLVSDNIKVIRNPETQESKGFAFIEAPNTEEMNAIIRRFDRAPLEDRLLRANPAQPAKPRTGGRPGGPPTGPQGPHAGHAPSSSGHNAGGSHNAGSGHNAGGHTGGGHGAPHGDRDQRPPRRGKRSGAKRSGDANSHSPFAEELAKAL